MMAILRGETDGLISLHADTAPSSAAALELALDAILRRKGRVLDSAVDSEAILHAHLSSPLRAQLDELARARTELAALLYAHPEPRGASDRAAVTTARSHIDDLEAALARASAEFRAQSSTVTAAEIQAALPADAALVEFMRYRRFHPGQAVQRWQEERYIAYVFTPRGEPQAIALGAAAPIDAEIDAVLAAMTRRTSTSHATAALRRLDALLFAPIRARLIGVAHVILAPDSKLNLVPFEALVDPHGHHALESHVMSYVTTRRDLLRVVAPLAARELAGLDLWGTQLVVLSACETGVGAASSGDGVYGLRRALVLAGAASQVVSLWRVDDQATRALMRDFYAGLARGTGRAEALRRAKLHLLRQPQYAHPYYWAAFIPAGDWRPLDPAVIGHAQRP